MLITNNVFKRIVIRKQVRPCEMVRPISVWQNNIIPISKNYKRSQWSKIIFVNMWTIILKHFTSLMFIIEVKPEFRVLQFFLEKDEDGFFSFKHRSIVSWFDANFFCSFFTFWSKLVLTRIIWTKLIGIGSENALFFTLFFSLQVLTIGSDIRVMRRHDLTNKKTKTFREHP